MRITACVWLIFLLIPASVYCQDESDLEVGLLPFLTKQGGAVVDTEYAHHFGKRLGRVNLTGQIHLTKEWHNINSQHYSPPGLNFFALGTEEIIDTKGAIAQSGASINLVETPTLKKLAMLLFEGITVGRYWRISGRSHHAQQTLISWETKQFSLVKIKIWSEGFSRSDFNENYSFAEALLWFKRTNKWKRWSFGGGVHRHEGTNVGLIGARYAIGKLHNHKD